MFLQLFVAFIALLFTRVLWMRWKYDLHKIPSPPGLPFLGHTLLFAGAKGEKELTYARAYWWKQLGWPKLMKVNLSGRTVLWTTDMECGKSIILSKTDDCSREMGYITLKDINGEEFAKKNLMKLSKLTPYVKAIRRCYLSAFNAANLKIAVPKVNKLIDQMIRRIESERDKGPIDVQNLCVSFTLDVIGQVALGTNLGGLDDSTDIHRLMIETGYIARERLLNPFKTWYCELFPRSHVAQQRNDRVNRLLAEWDRITREILNKKAPENEVPLWLELRTLVDPETGETLPFNDLRTELATVVIGGMDTTGHQLAWILGLLSCHPRVTEKILEELREKGLSSHEARKVTFEDLADLTYLAAVVKEGMRCVSISGGTLPRVATKDMTILGYRVPKGTWMSLAANRWMHIDEYWTEPEEFKPERWLTGEDMSQKHYLGFSYGPRDCVGQRLATMVLRLTILRLVQRYRLSLTISQDELMKRARTGLVIQAIDGIWLNMHPRDMSL